jgi:glycine betaine catabolism B
LSEDFVKVAESKDIGPSTMKAVNVAGEKVWIINIEGSYYAIGNVCTHMGGPLNEGTLEGFEVGLVNRQSLPQGKQFHHMT